MCYICDLEKEDKMFWESQKGKEAKIVNRIEVTLIGVNKDGKTCMQVVETDTLVGAVRLVLAGKVKRGYKLVKYVIEEKEILV